MFCLSLGGSKLVCFNDYFSQPLIKVWKKLQLLWQHTKNDHSNRRNACQKEGSKQDNQNILPFLLYPELPKPSL